MAWWWWCSNAASSISRTETPKKADFAGRAQRSYITLPSSCHNLSCSSTSIHLWCSFSQITTFVWAAQRKETTLTIYLMKRMISLCRYVAKESELNDSW